MVEKAKLQSSDRPEEWTPLEEDIKAFMDGEETAVAPIVAYLIEKLLPALTKRFGKSPIAHRIEDVLQDGLVKINLNKKQFDPSRGRFDVWAYRIVLNCAYDEIERIKHEAGTVDLDLSLIADDSESIVGSGSPSPSASFSGAASQSERQMAAADRGRVLRIWLEQPGEALWVDETYRLGVDFLEPVPDKGFRGGMDPRSVVLTVEIWSADVATEPLCQPLRLPTHGKTEPVYFQVKPLREGSLSLNLSVFTLREKKLLQKLKIELPPVKYRIGPSVP